MIRGARFPGRYISGPGALGRLGEEAQKYGPPPPHRGRILTRRRQPACSCIVMWV